MAPETIGLEIASTQNASMVELVDTPDLGSGSFESVGSSPIRGTLTAELVGYQY